MVISTRGRYALTIMTDLALNYKNDTFLSLKEISEKENISVKYLEQLMMKLKSAGYLEIKRGNVGGYKLKYEPGYYKIGDIIRTCEGEINPTNCTKSDNICPKKNKCKSYNLWKELDLLINNYLDSKTLKDMMEE